MNYYGSSSRQCTHPLNFDCAVSINAQLPHLESANGNTDKGICPSRPRNCLTDVDIGCIVITILC